MSFRSRALIAALFMGLVAAPAPAQPVTDSAAATIEADLQRYFGKTPGVVQVTPEGKAYALTLDPTPLLPPDLRAKVELTPLRLSVTAKGEGLWAVKQDQPLSLRYTDAPRHSLTLTVDRVLASGIYDAKLGLFREAQVAIRKVARDETRSDAATGEVMRHVSAIQDIAWRAQAIAGSTGADVTDRTEMIGVSNSLSIAPVGAPPFTLDLRLDRIQTERSLTGLRTEALHDLVRFMVANVTPATLPAQQEGLRQRLLALVPGVERISHKAIHSKVSIQSGGLTLALDRATLTMEAEGLTETATARQSWLIEGIKPDAPLLIPAWAGPLLPDRLRLDIQLGGFHPAAPLRLIIGAFDAGAVPRLPADLRQRLWPLLAPEGLDLTVQALELRAPAYLAQGSGAVHFTDGATPPTGRGAITVEGWDRIAKALEALPEADRPKANAALALIGGLGRAAPGGRGLVWDIDAETRPGTVLVNGLDLSRMAPK